MFGEAWIEQRILKMFIDESGASDEAAVVRLDLKTWPAKFLLIDATYDGQPMPIPDYYDMLLHDEYGNYMEFPPPEQRNKRFFSEWIFEESNVR